MITTPQIVQTSAQLTACISLVIPREEIQTVMGPGIEELMKVVADQGIEIVGPWFTHHRRRPSETFDFEICVPVGAAVIASGRVRPNELQAATVARAVCSGSYEGLGSAWSQLHDWITENGHAPAKDLWECYVAGPESSADPGDWRTELNQPIIQQTLS
ncbi:MAG: GyrI-like domain-containing protein [Verrucomicrobiae bacterium]|nr:GyrI-like domain-containing protein [Verrucomicrobiae bacterium]